ncbi:ROK family glucokinase [Fusibacter tunisiensis]|uniref:Glucokinase n=1 Tax=Fusibacter tunisiensis TaxID=1008308 RepID=A0ABS2MQT3_9FIRM|nr:glucokinase [Fusibacter tunisiensis]
MYIGIDLGGTNIAGGLVVDSGDIIKKTSVPTDPSRGADAVIADILKVIYSLLEGLEPNVVKGVGIGIPGIADPHTGEVIACVNLNWYHVPLKDRLQTAIDLPIYIDNDATVAAVAEFSVAQQGKYSNAVMLTLGTGVGGGIILDGKAISGHHGIGSELGHMIVGEGLYDCNCGRNGCLETFVSSLAIIRYAKHLLIETPESLILEYAKGDWDQINGEIIFKAAMLKDPVAVKVIDRMVKYLAIGIMNTVSFIDPEIVVLGGGLANAGDFLLDKVKTTVEALKYFKATDCARVELAKLKNDAGIIGAAMYAKIQD